MAGMDAIVDGRERVLIQQTKEWGEILLGFESRNRFRLTDDRGALLGYAAEEAGGLGTMLLRNMLGHCRAAKVHVYGPGGEVLGRGDKPFRFFFHRMDVFDGGVKVGAVQRKWSFFKRVFAVENAAGVEVMTIVSPFFRPWTFTLSFDGTAAGVIRKKWGGVLKEMFTDADSFGVEFSPHVPVEVRKLLLVATFLIDFVCFEKGE